MTMTSQNTNVLVLCALSWLLGATMAYVASTMMAPEATTSAQGDLEVVPGDDAVPPIVLRCNCEPELAMVRQVTEAWESLARECVESVVEHSELQTKRSALR